ncbi:hypothetical protein SAMD00079811_06610 [Scytonema sp. HK-05]|uniref:hypothetical protein n=1 Tax=Scytonema sp. HK-05 TaxID=1137095 RepID=UPI000936F9B9|nr:hypothetical protein [Scytonema sp. HK-05]OKH59843.1 hypothetical protein NIES2130_06655 [Scytonema sp. HK-05]BAY43083.1 hypothetical protein SAMD00079811_06610 [Scytonema sp. HK-05]
MNSQPEDPNKQVQQRAFENVNVGRDFSIESLTQIINLVSQPNNQKNSFCSLLEWIHKKSVSLEQLPPCYQEEVLQILRINVHIKEHNILDFTAFEVKVFDLIFNFCHYYLNKGKPRSNEFASFKKKDYYSYMKKLIEDEETIRVGTVRLSSLIKDKEMSILVKKVEKIDEF